MGFWNTTLYSNDITCDIRDSYLELLKHNSNNVIIYQNIIKEYQELFDTDEEPLFWYALADVQWDVGRLSERVKNNVLKYIEEQAGSSFWEDDLDKQSEWHRTLQQLQHKIQSPMPPIKRLRKKIDFKKNPWNVGDVYAYEFHTEKAKEYDLFGKYILIQKIGNVEYYEDIMYSVVHFYDKVFDFLPDEIDLKQYRILPLTLSPKDCHVSLSDYYPPIGWYLCASMLYEKKSIYPQKHLTFLTNCKVQEKSYVANDMTDFFLDKNEMEDWIIDFYISWINVNY